MRFYKVKKTFRSSRIGMRFVGTVIPENQLQFLTASERANIEEFSYNKDFSVFQYGLIFQSKEIKFPNTPREETYEEMKCNILSQVDNSCPGDRKKEDC